MSFNYNRRQQVIYDFFNEILVANREREEEWTKLQQNLLRLSMENDSLKMQLKELKEPKKHPIKTKNSAVTTAY